MNKHKPLTATPLKFRYGPSTVFFLVFFRAATYSSRTRSAISLFSSFSAVVVTASLPQLPSSPSPPRPPLVPAVALVLLFFTRTPGPVQVALTSPTSSPLGFVESQILDLRYDLLSYIFPLMTSHNSFHPTIFPT